MLDFEKEGGFTYLTGSKGISWTKLGNLMQDYCLNSNDAMIANIAFSIGASAIVTTDCNYAQVADEIDIYMPSDVADSCVAYDNAND